MPRDTLETVLDLRKRAVDEVRNALASSLAAAAAAHEQASAAERSIEQEAQRATNLAGGDNLVEAFAAWLPGARHRAAQARDLHCRHEADIARSRAELQACRTALESVEALIAERNVTRIAAETRRNQAALDEAAARTAPNGRQLDGQPE